MTDCGPGRLLDRETDLDTMARWDTWHGLVTHNVARNGGSLQYGSPGSFHRVEYSQGRMMESWALGPRDIPRIVMGTRVHTNGMTNGCIMSVLFNGRTTSVRLRVV